MAIGVVALPEGPGAAVLLCAALAREPETITSGSVRVVRHVDAAGTVWWWPALRAFGHSWIDLLRVMAQSGDAGGARAAGADPRDVCAVDERRAKTMRTLLELDGSPCLRLMWPSALVLDACVGGRAFRRDSRGRVYLVHADHAAAVLSGRAQQ